MKRKITLTKICLLVLMLCLSVSKANAISGIYESYIIMKLNSGTNSFYDALATTANPDFNGANLGSFNGTQTLILAGGQNKTYKCDGCDITNGRVYYRIYLTGGTPGSFLGPLNMSFVSNDAGGCGGNQTWEISNNTTNVLQGLAPGNYKLEVYTSADYQNCGTGTNYANNGGANYIASFTVVGVFGDGFNRATLSPGGNPQVTYTNTLATGTTATINGSSFAEIANSTTSGVSYISAPLSGYNSPFTSTLSSNPGLVTWTFNFRWNRTGNPAQPASGSYGQAIILAGTNTNLSTAGNGYAIVYGSTGTPDPIRLVQYTTGVTGTLTDICSSGASDISNTNNYASVRVTYNPVGNLWSLYVRDDGASAWVDPSSGVILQKGATTANSTYTASAMTHFGFLWSHANTAGNTGQFDNYLVQVATDPSLSTNGTTSLAFGNQNILTNSTSQSFNLSGSYLTGAPGTITISASNTDFQVSNDNSTFGSSTTIPYSSATLASTPVYVRFTPQSAGAKFGTITLSGGGVASPPSVAVSGTGVVPAPTSNAASNILCSSFNANWSSVTGASSYRLDVSTSPTFSATSSVASEGFENTLSLFSLTSGTVTYHQGNSGASDAPANSPLANAGTYSLGKNNGSATITSNAINTSSYSNVNMTFRLASFSLTNAANGADGGDIVTVEISPDGGTTYYSTVRVLGNANAYWAYSATGVASTAYDGNVTPVDFQPASGGSRTTDGYSTVTVTGLPLVASLRIRITLLNDAANERWNIDNLSLTGTAGSYVSGYQDLNVANVVTYPVNTNLSANTTYYYRVRAVNNSIASANSSVVSLLTLTPAAVTSVTSNSPICVGSTLNLSANGVTGTAPIAYSWSGTGTFTNGNTSTPSVTGAATGSYSVIASNACGNASSVSTSVTVNANPAISLVSSTNNTCHGGSAGAIDVTVSGGTAPYTCTTAGATLVFTHEVKNQSHPYYGLGHPHGFAVGGIQGLEFTMVRGVTYTLDLTSIAPNHPVYLTNSAIGAGAGTQYTTPTQGTTVTFTPGVSTPNLIYYQCGNHQYMGWKINVVDPPLNCDLSNLVAGTYTITVTDASGCTATLAPVTITEPAAVIYYLDADGDNYGDAGITALGGCTPPAGYSAVDNDCDDSNADINPGAPEICDNDIDDNCDGIQAVSTSSSTSVTICNTSLPYSWNNNSFNAGGSYDVTLPGANQYACDSIATLVLTVENTPLQPATPSGPTSRCSGDVSVYTIPSPQTGVTYTWSEIFGYATVQSGQGSSSPTIAFGNIANAGISFYQFTIVPSNTCGNGPTRTFAVRNKVSVPTVTGNTLACQSSSENYTASSTGATAYTWTVSNVSTMSVSAGQGTANATISYTGAFTSGTISVTASNACFTSAARTVSVKNTVGQPTAVNGAASACPGSSQLYNCPLVTGASSYNWTVTGTGVSIGSGQGTANVTINFAANFTIGTVSVASVSSCPGTSAYRSKQVVSSKPGTPAAITGLANGVCATAQNYFCSSVTGATSYNWTVVGGTIQSGNGNNAISVQWSNVGVANPSISVYASNSCGNGGTRTIAIRLIPEVPAALSGDNSVCLNDVEVYQLSSPTFGATGYSWAVPAFASVIPNNDQATVVWGNTGGNVVVTPFNACGSSNNRALAVTVNCKLAAETNANQELYVYPNPAHEKVMIDFTAASDENMQLNIFDATGRSVHSQGVNATTGNNSVELNVNSFAKGLYFIKMTGENGFTKSFTIE